MKEAPASWIQKVHESLQPLTEVPLWGKAPPFPWENFAKALAAALEIPELRIAPQKVASFTSLPADSAIFELSLSPLSTPLYFAISSSDLERLTGYLLTSNHKPISFPDPVVQEGFFQFLALQAIDVAASLNLFHELSPTLGKKISQLPQLEDAVSQGISISAGRHTFIIKMVASQDFLRGYRSHFATRKIPLTDIAKKLEVTLRLQMGYVDLRPEEWRSVKEGDLLILDHSDYNMNEKRGGGTFLLNATPLFRVRVKSDKIKIVDYAFYTEETPMSDTFDQNSPEEMDEEPLWAAEKNRPSLENLISSSEIPLHIAIEMGRVEMNLEKLLQLQPGNFVELQVRPEQGVTLTVNGKAIARGELVQIGETLGVKIIEIG